MTESEYLIHPFAFQRNDRAFASISKYNTLYKKYHSFYAYQILCTYKMILTTMYLQNNPSIAKMMPKSRHSKIWSTASNLCSIQYHQLMNTSKPSNRSSCMREEWCHYYHLWQKVWILTHASGQILLQLYAWLEWGVHILQWLDVVWAVPSLQWL